MKIHFISICVIFVFIKTNTASKCGCKTMRKCYVKMLETLRDRNEASCIEDSAIGSATMIVFFKALKDYCSEVFDVKKNAISFEGRTLYEVILDSSHLSKRRQEKAIPTILIEAGQLAGSASVLLAMFVIEQLVACEEYADMTQKARWVILPCSNPDGQEYARFNIFDWIKNVHPSNDSISFGVDISRNFDSHFGECVKESGGFSPNYEGPKAASEKETVFIKEVMKQHKNITAYVSIRRKGHSILYPYANGPDKCPNCEKMSKMAGEIATRVNNKAGAVQVFMNNSIFKVNGKPHCGHSVDYAIDLGIPIAFEMRVFLEQDIDIMSLFQTFPKGLESSLLAGYFNGIRELFNLLTKPDKKANVSERI